MEELETFRNRLHFELVKILQCDVSVAIEFNDKCEQEIVVRLPHENKFTISFGVAYNLDPYEDTVGFANVMANRYFERVYGDIIFDHKTDVVCHEYD